MPPTKSHLKKKKKRTSEQPIYLACWPSLLLLKTSIYGKEKPKLEGDRSQNKKRKEHQNKYGKTNELWLQADSVAPSLLRDKLSFKTMRVSEAVRQFG